MPSSIRAGYSWCRARSLVLYISAEYVRGRSVGSSSTPDGVRGGGYDDIRSHSDDAGNERTLPAGDH